MSRTRREGTIKESGVTQHPPVQVRHPERRGGARGQTLRPPACVCEQAVTAGSSHWRHKVEASGSRAVIGRAWASVGVCRRPWVCTNPVDSPRDLPEAPVPLACNHVPPFWWDRRDPPGPGPHSRGPLVGGKPLDVLT